MKMKRSRSEVFGLRRVKLPHILFVIAALYLIVVCFKFSVYFEASTTTEDEAVRKYQLEVSKPSLGSAYEDGKSESLENDNRFEKVKQEKKLEEESDDNIRERLENGSRIERASQKENDDSLPPIDLRYGRLTGDILRRRHRTRDMTELEKMADEAWTLGSNAWEEVHKYNEKDNELASILEGKQERCPPWVSMSGEELTKGDRIMFLPCGLAAGSSITVAGTPQHAHNEYVPQLAKIKAGDPLVMVSQFKVELQGLKSVVADDPPKILHLNPRLRGDWSQQPVIEHNTCYRMQWGTAQRCDGLPSQGDDDMLVRITDNYRLHKEESNISHEEMSAEGSASRKASVQRYLEKRKERFKSKRKGGGGDGYINNQKQLQMNEQSSRSTTCSPPPFRPPNTPNRFS